MVLERQSAVRYTHGIKCTCASSLCYKKVVWNGKVLGRPVVSPEVLALRRLWKVSGMLRLWHSARMTSRYES